MQKQHTGFSNVGNYEIRRQNYYNMKGSFTKKLSEFINKLYFSLHLLANILQAKGWLLIKVVPIKASGFHVKEG